MPFPRCAFSASRAGQGCLPDCQACAKHIFVQLAKSVIVQACDHRHRGPHDLSATIGGEQRRKLKILLAIDDSKYSEAATEAVLAHARPANTEIRLLHVLEPFPVALAEALGSKDFPDFTAARTKLRSQVSGLLARTADRFRSAGFVISYSLGEGDARETILDYATRWPADLVVVGSHGRKGLDRFLTGSVSEAVMRHAPCSVEIVRIGHAGETGQAHT